MSTSPGTGPAPPTEPPLIGLAVLARIAFAGGDLASIGTELLTRTRANPLDGNAWMDLSIIGHLSGNRELGLALQEQALAIRRVYRLTPATGRARARVLALLVPGDLTENNALEFLLEGSDIQLDMLYVTPGVTAPPLPTEYDLAIVAIGESDRNRRALDHVAMLIRDWPVPVLDPPERIAELSRDRTAAVIGDIPGVVVPRTTRLDRDTLASVAAGSVPLTDCASDAELPLLVRPVDSHKGNGLARVDTLRALHDYLGVQVDAEFYVAPFVDYRAPDGRYWKYRILFIGGRPYLCHVAISEHYIVHYMSAGMSESAQKRTAEAHAMSTFDTDFAARHGPALAMIAERLGLAYVGIDCSETRDGALVVFEADASLTVHAMDPADVYPYKAPQMQRVFAAFRELIIARTAS